MTPSDRDHQYMTLALALAAKGRGRTHPNPMVGAVVVAGGRIVGQGYHRRAGGPHAEVLALRAAGRRARGATLYVTLEPCSHTNKRTPPCVPVVVSSGVRRVVVAMVDPNPLVSGRGVRRLRGAGLRVEVGCGERDARRLNAAYGHWMTTGRPFVILKAGMTLDGKIATASGESRWITGEAARRDAHRLRAEVDAVLVGIDTILRDNPALTARLSDRPRRLAPRQPIRIVVDSRLRIPLSAEVFRGLEESPTVVATTTAAPSEKVRRIRKAGADVLILPAVAHRVSLRDLSRQLGRLGVQSLLIEGGATVNASAMRAGLVNRVRFYVAPRVLGGGDALGVIGGSSPRRLQDTVGLEDLRTEWLGHDMVIEGEITG